MNRRKFLTSAAVAVGAASAASIGTGALRAVRKGAGLGAWTDISRDRDIVSPCVRKVETLDGERWVEITDKTQALNVARGMWRPPVTRAIVRGRLRVTFSEDGRTNHGRREGSNSVLSDAVNAYVRRAVECGAEWDPVSRVLTGPEL